MDQTNNKLKAQDKTCPVTADTSNICKNKPKHRSTKQNSDESSSSSDGEDILPENILETEKHLHASAVKNNLDEISVRKILKKVVTNDHVLALVKLQADEEKNLESDEKKPTKLTRSKIKELMKVSPKASSWKTWDLQLSPIKHIPVKTRPEVTALIAQDLPEDEDDDEYEPTHDDAPSDDDHTLESCSDIESQPRTPATPKSRHTSSPQVVKKDGPFVVPQSVSGTKRKLEMDEEDATIARRTRSKLSLSSTSIEHIESTFVPPDDLPMPAVDNLWSEFLNECLNPASTSRNEDDDETDPEYNVAADPDAAVDEDDEGLGKNIIKISKKELNDLVTELFGIMPEAIENDELAENLATTVLTDNGTTDLTHWEGKQEPLSEEEEELTVKISDKLTFENRDKNTRLSIGKTEIDEVESNDDEPLLSIVTEEDKVNIPSQEIITPQLRPKITPQVNIAVKEQSVPEIQTVDCATAPPILRYLNLNTEINSVSEVIKVEISPDFTVFPEQIQILQQQLRQHIQLATSNFLQLYIHPIHWNYGPRYKRYIETFVRMCDSNPHSVANVCNLRPALELISSWEKTVAEDTPENAEMIKFVQAACEKSRRRIISNNLYLGDFHDIYKDVVANSTVFLYPYLLPPSPYRGDATIRKFQYLRSEDELIAIGLDEFWQYVDNNSKMFKIRKNSTARRRPGLFMTVQLVAKHMFPWALPKVLMNHIIHVRKHGDTENPITRFFKSRKVVPVEHKLLPFNPKLTMYEQPETEMPRVWLRYLAKTSKRFKAHLPRSSQLCGRAPEGVTVAMGKSIEMPVKNPLPIDFTKEIICLRPNQLPKPNLIDKFDVNINNGVAKKNVMMAMNLYSVVETSTGALLVPLTIMPTNTVNSTKAPISSPAVIQGTIIGNNLPGKFIGIQNNIEKGTSKEKKGTLKSKKIADNDHCECCKILKKICDGGQTLMVDYFEPNEAMKRPPCYCKNIKYPKITNRLKLFISNYKCQSKLLYQEIDNMLTSETKTELENADFLNASDLAFVTLYQLRLLRRISSSTNNFKNRIHSLFTKFNIGQDDPVQLAKNLHRACNGELIEIYTEFLGFLTPAQAEKEDVFNAYVASHLRQLVKMVCDEITNEEKRDAVLRQFKTIFTDKHLTSCQTCSGLLSKMDGYPRIAKHLFSLFPHTRKPKCTKQDNVIRVSIRTNPSPATATLTLGNHTSTNENLTPARENHVWTNENHTLTNKIHTTTNYNHTTTNDNRTLTNDNHALTNKIHTPTNDNHALTNKIHTPTNDNDTLTNDNHALINDNHTLTNDNHTLTNKIHTPTKDNHALTNKIHTPTNDNHTLTNKIHTPTKDNHALTNKIHTPTNDNHALRNDNHALTNENHALTNENHALTNDNHTLTNENHTLTCEKNRLAQETRALATSGEELQDKQSANLKITCSSNCLVIQPKYKDTVKDITKANSENDTNEAQNNEDEDTMSDSSETHMIIIEEDIKSEPSEWKRDEDKLILEMLKESLTPEERNDKTIIEILEEKHILRVISDSLTDKTVDEIQERILYLLGILVLSESHK